MGFGGESLFESITLSVEPGERICLIGRNGTGKSTLLSLLAGVQPPDAGTVSPAKGLRMRFLPQELPGDLTGPVGMLSGIAGPEGHPSVEAAQSLSRLQVDPAWNLEELSGGELRRVMLARTLAGEWDLLLLDEPTNHLDIDSIEWLEQLLLNQPRSRSLVFVSHDRRFSAELATRVVALDRARLYSFPGGYERFIERQDAARAAEARQEALFDRKLAAEEAWLRRGVKARRTRNEGRVRQLEDMRAAYAARRTASGTARMRIAEAARSGDLVTELEKVSFSWPAVGDRPARPLIRELTTRVLKGDRLGIVGPNGAGKTSLIRLMLGSLVPDSGRIRRGSGLEVIYFDQRREQLNGDQRLYEAIGDGYDTVDVGGRQRHVLAYMQDFLFAEEDRNRPVRTLSGGEQSRLVLARLFARPSNLLVLDEPTNDLDQETLELLEDLLLDYQGTILLVSHDRSFMDNVITDALLLDGAGGVEEHAGGSQDWMPAYHRMRRAASEWPAGPVSTGGSAEAEAARRSRGRRLGYREREELEQLPARIEALEAEQAAVNAQLTDPELYRSDDGSRTRELTDRLASLETELYAAFQRWEELSEIAEGSGENP